MYQGGRLIRTITMKVFNLEVLLSVKEYDADIIIVEGLPLFRQMDSPGYTYTW